ncbi:hypothetical protein [Methanofollis formosanus]|nr:hypothetical protein [Methanofollis formosanus]
MVRMAPLTYLDAIPPADRERLAALERRAEACEQEAATCRYAAERIRRHYEQMVAVFGVEACAAHARRRPVAPIIEVP